MKRPILIGVLGGALAGILFSGGEALLAQSFQPQTGVGASVSSPNTWTATQTFSAQILGTLTATTGSPGIWSEPSGAWYAGTTPQVLIGAVGSTFASTGTGLGINSPSGFTGNLLDLQANGVDEMKVGNTGGTTFGSNVTIGGSSAYIFSASSKIVASGNGGVLFDTNGNTTTWTLDVNGHEIHTVGGSGAAPTCGTGCASITGNDNAFVATTGSTVTAVTVNFGHTWTTNANCTANVGGSAADGVSISAISATAVTFTISASVTSQPLYGHCTQ